MSGALEFHVGSDAYTICAFFTKNASKVFPSSGHCWLFLWANPGHDFFFNSAAEVEDCFSRVALLPCGGMVPCGRMIDLQ